MKTLPAIELKRELKELLSDRTKPRLLCPRGHSIVVEGTHKVLTCDACCAEGTPNPFFCANCRSPVARSACTSKTCLNSREVLNASLRQSPKKWITYEGQNRVEVFERRACIDCHVVIDHEAGCKYMRCTRGACPAYFCFACLKRGARGTTIVTQNTGLPAPWPQSRHFEINECMIELLNESTAQPFFAHTGKPSSRNEVVR